MNTKTDHQQALTPAEYSRALGYIRLLVSMEVSSELDALKARRRAITDTKRRLSEQEAALKTRQANLRTATAAAETTTPIHPAAAALQAPTPPTPTPARIKVPTYTPLPDKKPLHRIPTPDHTNPESVRIWALRRWPDSTHRASLRARTAKADEDRYAQDRANEKQGK